jgi:sortase A
MPSLAKEHVVLANTNTTSTEFAPSHLQNSVLPGEQGNSVLTVPALGYKSFLRHLQTGDTVILESMSSGRWHYRIVDRHIVLKTDTTLLEPTSNRQLTLVSCYPCEAHSTEQLRYVVIAEEAERIRP